MGTITELGGKSVHAVNSTQFLGQDKDHNPLYELAKGIMGNAATSQGRGDMSFGGGGGIPVLTSYSDPAGGQHTQLVRKNFTTPTTTIGGVPPPGGGGGGGGTPVGGGPPIVIPPGPTPRPGPGYGGAAAAAPGDIGNPGYWGGGAPVVNPGPGIAGGR